MEKKEIIKYLKENYKNDYALLISRFGDVEKYIVEPTKDKIVKQHNLFIAKNKDRNYKIEIVNL